MAHDGKVMGSKIIVILESDGSGVKARYLKVIPTE